MKIAFVGLKGIPAKYGGIEHHVENLSRRLAEQGHEVTVFCRNDYTLSKERLGRVKLIRLPRFPFRYLETISHSLISFVMAQFDNFDIIHLHNLGIQWLAIMSPLIKPIVICTLHAPSWEETQWGSLGRIYLRLCLKVSAALADGFIAVSTPLALEVKRVTGRQPYIIPNGVGLPDPGGQDICERYGLQAGFYILTVGRIIPDRAIEILLKAVKCLPEKLKVAVVGDSKQHLSYIQQLKEIGKDRAVFAGYVFGQELATLYANAALYVHPSRVEGQSIALLEAMWFGRCVIASNIPANVEILQNCKIGEDYTIGFTFKVDDVNDLSQRLKYLVERQDIVKKVGLNAARAVRNLHNWDKITKETIKVYKEIQKEKKKRIYLNPE